ncbi:hypothetical protein GEMRC1_003535 [Eukaryota sp. GEM-RC1]
MSLRETLINKRDSIECRIKEIVQILETDEFGGSLSASLVDEEGFPRADIDIIQCRSLRHELALLRTDLNNVDEQIYTLLQTELPKTANANHTEQMVTSYHKKTVPLFTVGEIASATPAFRAGLQEGDQVLQFGSLSVENLPSGCTKRSLMSTITEILNHSENNPMSLLVERNGSIVELSLTPKRTAQGLLGCKLVL